MAYRGYRGKPTAGLALGIALAAGLPLAGCGGGTSSGGADLEGVYTGSVRSASGVNPMRITVSAGGNVAFGIPGGIFCDGDQPDDTELDGRGFDGSSDGDCRIGGQRCPTFTTITGRISDEEINGTGEVRLSCSAGATTSFFDFFAELDN